MNPFQTVVFCLAVSLSICHGQDSEARVLDPRLAKAIAAADELREAGSWDSVNAKIEERTRKYCADLSLVEEEIHKSGNLDHVLQVRKERVAWALGDGTPAIDPKDESIILELRKLRYYFDKEVSEAKEAHQEKINTKAQSIVDGLAKLEEALTKEGKIEDALEARKLNAQISKGIVASHQGQEGFDGSSDTVNRFFPPKEFKHLGDEELRADAKKSAVALIAVEETGVTAHLHFQGHAYGGSIASKGIVYLLPPQGEEHEVGTWDLREPNGVPTEIIFDITEQVLANGEYKVYFRYKEGGRAFTAEDVKIVIAWGKDDN